MRSVLRLLVLASSMLGACASQAPIRLAGTTQDAATLAMVSLPEQLEVAQINGVAVAGASGMGRHGDRTLELAPGRYELLVFYRELWERGDNHDVLQSNPALFTIDAAAGQRYRLDYPRPATFAEAEALARSFSGWATDEAKGRRIDSQASGMEFRAGLLAQIRGDRTLVPTAPNEAGQQLVAPLMMPAPVAPPSVASTAASTEPAKAWAPDDQLLLVKGWWNQASPDQRRAFLNWIAAPQ